MTTPIKLLLVDDQPLIRQGLCALLNADARFTVIAELSDGRDVLQTLNAHSIDLVLLDLRMPYCDGLSVLQQLHEANNTTPVLVLTTFDERQLTLNCLQLGAKGYVRKDVSIETLQTAILSIAAGQTWIQPAITERLQHHQRYASQTEQCRLSASENKVLRLLAHGYSNLEIASALHKSPGTIRNTVSDLLAKLEVRDRTRAVLKAIELGLL